MKISLDNQYETLIVEKSGKYDIKIDICVILRGELAVGYFDYQNLDQLSVFN